jgi:hypothetical protein
MPLTAPVDMTHFGRKTVVPLIFHEKTQMQFVSSCGNAWDFAGVCFTIRAIFLEAILRQLVGGALISRLMDA